MGFSIIFGILVIISSTYCQNLTIDEGEWWGPEELEESNDTTITPFEIDFDEDMLQDLRYRLLNYRPSNPSFSNISFQYGFNTQQMPAWINYWANDYSYAERLNFLNNFPHFKIKVQGLQIHFIRIIPEVPDYVKVIPLLLLHGWPGSVREFYETLPYLTSVSAHRTFALEIIAPSLPGFAFSDAAVRPGLSSAKIAVILRNMMHKLGHYKFCVQGGDWGSIIGSDLATLFPLEVIGFHSNFASSLTYSGLIRFGLGSLDPSLVVNAALANRMYPLQEKLLFLLREFGYFHIQATKPDTIGIPLSDSPAGLLAYILQLMSTGAGNENIYLEDGGLSHFSKEFLIDNLMFYWSTNSITTSLRIYTESYNKQFSSEYEVLNTTTSVPTWVLQARNEIIYQSPKILKTKYLNLIHATVWDDGGHFIAQEKPQLFAEDVLNAVEAFLKWQDENETVE